MKSLFDEYELYNNAGDQFSDEIENVIRPIIQKYQAQNYSLHDMRNILTSITGCIISELILQFVACKLLEDKGSK